MFKTTLSILALCMTPTLALAADEHSHAQHADHHSSAPAIYGQAGHAEHISRTIDILMDDQMQFTPNHIEVQANETVRFRLRNSGRIPHEMVLGTLDELKAHAAEMLAMPDMAHSEPNMINLEAGQQGELIWQFANATTVDFACLIPGHSEAGMLGTIEVQ